jgi:hypothetical protein
MADDKPSSNSSATDAGKIDTIRSSSGTPTSVYRSWATGNVSRPSEVAQRRLKLFAALEKFIRGHGGSIISQPGARFLRIECPIGSDLPVKLAHYNPVAAGSTMRTTNLGLFPADVFEISLD